MDTLLQDIRYALRTLARAPGFTLAAVATLGLGIGATTMIFSMTNGVLLRPFPFAQPDRLVAIAEDDLEANEHAVVSSYPTFLDWRAQSRTLASLGAVSDETITARFGEAAERLRGAHVSADMLPTLGVAPLLGRAFHAADDAPGAAPVVLLSHRIWQERYGGASQAIGALLSVNSEPHEIIGVMPPGFAFPERADLWIALGRVASQERGRHYLAVVGRLRGGATLAQLNAELAGISERLAQSHEENAGFRARAVSLREATTREIRPLMLILLGAVGFVLLIACANVANLMLARAVTREREVAIRTALGAARGRILRQLLTESALVAVAGGVLGVLLSMWWIDLLLAAIPTELPYWLSFDVDVRVLAFTSAVALGSALLFGLVPALQTLRPDQQSALKQGTRQGPAGGARARLRAAFVVAQLAASIVLLVGGLLMLRSFLAMRDVDPGFRTTGIVTMNVSLPHSAYPDADNVTAFHDELLARLRARPVIAAAELINNFPIGGSNATSNFSIEGTGEVVGVSAHNHVVTPGYFAAMAIDIERGRAFNSTDVPGAENVAIINRALAERFFPGIDPVGRGIRFGAGTDDFYRIVGVAADVNQRDVNQRTAEPSLYRPFAQNPWRDVALVVRARGDAAAIAAAIRAETRAIDPDIPVYDLRTVEQVLADAVWDARLNTILFGVFAAAALLLAAIGLHGVIAYSVAQRRHEIGVRVALGATTRDVLRLVVAQGMLLTGLGIAIGVTLAFAAARVLSALLFGVSSRDPVTFVTVPLLLAVVALAASWLPARRAARVDAMTALRAQ